MAGAGTDDEKQRLVEAEAEVGLSSPGGAGSWPRSRSTWRWREEGRKQDEGGRSAPRRGQEQDDYDDGASATAS